MRVLETRGLPANLDAERFVLGSVMLDGNRYHELALSVEVDDFSLDRNRQIWAAMVGLAGRGVSIDMVTVADEFRKRGELASIGGMDYLLGLDEGMVSVANLADWCNVLREKRLLRQVISLARGIEDAAILGADSALELIGKADVMVRALGMQTARSGAFLTPSEIIREAGGLQAYLTQEKIAGIPTGFPKLDEMTGGLKPGQLWVIAAETGAGKTTFATHLLQNMAEFGYPGSISSLEMTSQEVTDGLICRAGAINTQGLRKWHDRQAVSVAANAVAALPIHILDRPGLTVPKLSHELRRLRAEYGCCVAVVDYIQLMQPVGNFGSRAEAVASLTRGLKLIAMELGIGIIALSQLKRQENATSKRRPELSDLKESSSIEQDANVVLMLWGEYQPQMMRRYPWEILIRKQRGGPVGMIPYLWEKSTGTFIECEGGNE